jgi:hypothetical protein
MNVVGALLHIGHQWRPPFSSDIEARGKSEYINHDKIDYHDLGDDGPA